MIAWLTLILGVGSPGLGNPGSTTSRYVNFLLQWEIFNFVDVVAGTEGRTMVISQWEQ